MRLFVLLVRALTALVERVALVVSKAQLVLYGTLPALLPPEELRGLIRKYYDGSYRNVEYRYPADAYKWTLEPWEEQVVARHMTQGGTVLVLGAGVGRESIALAQRGYRVIGLDINHEGLRMAAKRAGVCGATAWFAQADFLEIPALPGRTDYVLLSGVMYSSIPGRSSRQTCVRDLRGLLKANGKIILNFVIAREPESRTHRLIRTLNGWILRLPWSNQTYQEGDSCTNGHFMHMFPDEPELRQELIETGATLLEVDWKEGFAVIA